MKKQKGFISTSIIYSFFLVFILIMIAFLMSFINKRFLVGKINDSFKKEHDVSLCQGDTLSDCLFKRQNIEEGFDEKSVEDIQQAIVDKVAKNPPDFTVAATGEEGMFAAEDDYTQRDEDGEIKNNTMSYYYRGDEDDNYVVFADQVWQIIRVNGDGSIRMIYKGQWDKKRKRLMGKDHVMIDLSSIGGNKYEKFHFFLSAVNNSKTIIDELKIAVFEPYVEGKCVEGVDGDFGLKLCVRLLESIREEYKTAILDYMGIISTNKEEEGAYFAKRIGYMGNDSSSFDYDKRFGNDIDSIAKTINDVFYKNILADDYEEFISADTIFCSDKNIINIDLQTDDVYEYNGYYKFRMNEQYPISYKCADSGTVADHANKAATNLSRYNVKINACTTYDCDNQEKIGTYWGCITWGTIFCEDWGYKDAHPCNDTQKACDSLGNGKLTYPVGLISLDELMYAGSTGSGSSNSYLKSNTVFWSMTPSYTSLADVNGHNNGARYFGLDNTGKIVEINDTSQKGTAAIRPVINLKSDILYCDGKGTAKDPYIIGNGSCS